MLNMVTIIFTTFSLPLLRLVNQNSVPFINSKGEEVAVRLEEALSWHRLEVDFLRNTHTFC